MATRATTVQRSVNESTEATRYNAPQVERVPVFNNMFSDSRIHPSHTYKYKYNAAPPFPSPDYVPGGRFENADVARDRYKYVKRPVVAYINTESSVMYQQQQQAQFQQQLQHQQQQQHQAMMQASAEKEIPEPPTKDQGTQSDYRENEAQTDPYTPDYVLDPDHTGPEPELVAMQELTFQNGALPVNQETVKLIDRIRRRRAVEAALPDPVDEKSTALRYQMLRDLEEQEQAEREEKINELQLQRLRKIRDAIIAREQEREERNRERIQSWQQQKLDTLAAKFEKIKEKRQKELRKLAKKYRNPEGTLEKRDIIEDYANFGSKTYAPIKREGRNPDKHTIGFEIRPVILEDPNGIRTLEQTKINALLKTKVVKPVRSAKPKNSAQRKAQQIVDDLTHASRTLEKAKTQSFDRSINLQELYKATPRIVRPPTPTLDFDDEEEEREVAIIMIQKLLRGRAAQNEFFEGKERALNLIRELQAVADLERFEEESLLDRERAREQREQEEMVVDMVHGLQGEIVSKALDYLSKELVRQREYQQIEEVMHLAHETRRQREAEESGRRQQEEELRAREEEQYRQVIRAHKQTIDMYLDFLIDETIENEAYEQAWADIESEHAAKHKKRKPAQNAEEQLRQDEEEVRELVAAFLLPQVEREMLRKRVSVDQRKFVKAAHESIVSMLQDVDNSVRSSTSSLAGL